MKFFYWLLCTVLFFNDVTAYPTTVRDESADLTLSNEYDEQNEEEQNGDDNEHDEEFYRQPDPDTPTLYVFEFDGKGPQKTNCFVNKNIDLGKTEALLLCVDEVMSYHVQ